jgi:hypothetical protein
MLGTTPAEGAKKVAFAYDYLGRRVEKKVWTYTNGSWPTQPSLVRRFVWSGWLLLMELDGLNNNAVVRRYTWGLDLAALAGQSSALPGGLQAAGGIGGLLAMNDVQGTPLDPNDDLNYVYLYDGNGNIGQLVDWAHDPNDAPGAIVATYEYDPYGNLTVQSGSYAQANPFRFSTKWPSYGWHWGRELDANGGCEPW